MMDTTGVVSPLEGEHLESSHTAQEVNVDRVVEKEVTTGENSIGDTPLEPGLNAGTYYESIEGKN